MSEFVPIKMEKFRVVSSFSPACMKSNLLNLTACIDCSLGDILNITVNPCQLSFYECDEDNYTSMYSRAFQRAKELSISVESFLGFVSRRNISVPKETISPREEVPVILRCCFSLFLDQNHRRYQYPTDRGFLRVRGNYV